MPRTPTQLYQGQPATTEETLVTVGSDEKWVITDIWLCNTAGTEETITLSAVEDGGSANDNNRLFENKAVPANDYKRLTGGGLVLEPSDFLSALQSSSGAITMTISGWVESY